MTDELPPLPPFLTNGAAPPAPSTEDGSARRASLRPGAWLATYRADDSALAVYDGTIRVEELPSSYDAGCSASGDLYQRPVYFQPGRPDSPILPPAPLPQNGIPIQPFATYRFYLSFTSIAEPSEVGAPLDLRFDRWRYNDSSAAASRRGTWVDEGVFISSLGWTAPPAGYPAEVDCLSGSVRGAAGAVVGTLSVAWVSKFLRKASIEIDSLADVEQPLGNGLAGDAHRDWLKVFRDVGWDMTVVSSQNNLASTVPSGRGWTDAELHASMLRWRNAIDLNAAWSFHLLCVDKIQSTPRGIMYDASGTDSNSVPREGAAMASSWIVDKGWGRATGKRFGAVPEAYFRAAVHEMGHAVGLEHNLKNQYFMDTSDSIAKLGNGTSLEFPDNIKWDFAEIDVRRLKHWPDIVVRPGGLPFGDSKPTFSPSLRDSIFKTSNVELSVQSKLDQVPLGAPVRLELTLRNTSDPNGPEFLVPTDIGLRAGRVVGTVVPALGPSKSFRSVVVNDSGGYTVLAPGEQVTSSVTLLRGSEGALFDTSGLHEVNVRVNWKIGDAGISATGSTTVLVTSAVNAGHAAVAQKLLVTPDVHLVLIFGGDHLTGGIAAIHEALRNEILRPHYAAIEAKRLATGFENRLPDLVAARQLIDDSTVLSIAEAKRFQSMFSGDFRDEL